MLEYIKEKIFNIHSVAGIEIRIEAEGDYSYNFIILENKNGNILVKDKGMKFVSFEDLMAKIPENLPVCLNISGKGVLFKRINEVANKDASKIIQMALPSANPADFYIQYYLQKDSGFVQLIKANQIATIFKQFQKENFSVINVSLGFFPLLNLMPLLNISFENGKELIGQYEFEGSDTKIENIQYVPDKAKSMIKIGDEEIQTPILMAYASGLQIFLSDVLQSNMYELAKWKEEYIHKQLFNKLLLGTIGLFLMTLLVNFFFYNHYSSLFAQYEDQKNINRSILETTVNLKKKFEEKEKFLNSSGWLNPSNLSLIVDRIAASIPSSVLLTDLSVNPVDSKKWKEQKFVEFTYMTIKVSGNCKRSVELNDWIKKLSAIEFVDKVDVKNYSHDEYENLGKFELEITVNE